MKQLVGYPAPGDDQGGELDAGHIDGELAKLDADGYRSPRTSNTLGD